MTARRPKVPRVGRPTPAVEDGPAGGAHEGADAARPTRPTASSGAGPVRTGSTPRKPSVPRRVGPSATKDPHPPGAVPQHGAGASPNRAVRATKEQHGSGSGSRVAPAPGSGGQTVPAATAAPEPAQKSAAKSASAFARGHASGPLAGGSTPASPSQARAAERSQLAGSIRRGRLGSRRASSAIQPAEEATPIPAKTFSGRLLALAVVLVAVIILLAPTVSRYVQQQAELEALRADIAAQQQQQDEYRSELARWDDPAFVKQQARERIFLVMPGETRYLVKGGTGLEQGTGEGSAVEPEDLPWVDGLWNSVERAATD